MEVIKIVGAIFGCLIPIMGFLYWHFKTVHSFKDEINNLKLQMKDLENKDNLQELTLDQLKELLPVLKTAIEIINKDKK